MYKQYKLIFVLTILIIIIFIGFFIFSDHFFIFMDRENYKTFLEGNSMYSPYKNGMSETMYVVSDQINELSSKNNLILIGGSTTREGVLPDQTILPDNWVLKNFGLSSDTMYSNKIIINYLNKYANHKLDKSDVIVIHIYYGSFVEKPKETDFTRQSIERLGYHIDDSGNIFGAITYPEKITRERIYSISEFVNIIFTKFDTNLITIKKIFVPEKYTNSSKSNEELLRYKKFWTDYTRNTSYPGNSTVQFKNDILTLKNQTNVIVVNSYIGSWQRSIPEEQKYEKWIESDLRPFLEDEHIPWIDFSSSIPDSEYGDSGHLFKLGRERYTTLFNNEINKILSNMTFYKSLSNEP